MHISRVSKHISVLASDIPSLDVDGACRCLSSVTMEISSSEFVLPAREIKPLNQTGYFLLESFLEAGKVYMHMCTPGLGGSL